MRRLSSSPTIATLAALAVVFAVQSVVGFATGPATVQRLFALSLPVTLQPWTVVTSVYAHSGPGHLLANAAALAIVGLLIERQTTPARFHAFFLVSGAIAGLTEVYLAAVRGAVLPGVTARVSVIGASGAIFALLGYLLTSNRLTDGILGRFRISPRVQLVLLALVAVGITLATAQPQVAVVAHFTGLLLGLIAGRLHVLRPRRSSAGPEPA